MPALSRASTLASVVGGAALLVLFLFFASGGAQPDIDRCFEGIEKKYDPATIPCLRGETRKILDAEGVRSALNFADSAIRSRSTFSITHVIMHEIGHRAAEETHSFEGAMAYLPRTAENLESYFHYDGYQHGVFMALFHMGKERKTMEQLMREACPDAFERNAFDAPAGSFTRVAAEQCFHAAGHALMSAADNEVPEALSFCDGLPQTSMQQWCQFGVFMENSYLYSDFHYPDAPRPYVSGASMLPLCRKVSEKHRLECARFAGRAFLHVEQGDFRGLFRECGAFSRNEEREVCVGQGARLFIPMLFENDFSGMIAACDPGDEALKGVCLNQTAVGIRQGAAGLENADRAFSFCGMLGDDERRGCEEEVRHMYVRFPPQPL